MQDALLSGKGEISSVFCGILPNLLLILSNEILSNVLLSCKERQAAIRVLAQFLETRSLQCVSSCANFKKRRELIKLLFPPMINLCCYRAVQCTVADSRESAGDHVKVQGGSGFF